MILDPDETKLWGSSTAANPPNKTGEEEEKKFCGALVMENGFPISRLG